MYSVNNLILIFSKLMQNPINPYGKAKKMAEDIILDFTKSKKSNMAVMILRFVFRSPYRIESME